jgi:hypothetical protein
MTVLNERLVMGVCQGSFEFVPGGPGYHHVEGAIPSESLPIHAADDNILIVGKNAIHISSERDIGRLDWTQSSAEYVLECTGKFTKLGDTSRHIPMLERNELSSLLRVKMR